MKILIPTRARPNRQITARQLYHAGIPYTLVRTLSDDSKYHDNISVDAVIADVTDIREKRQWIMDAYPNEKILVCDDDISFMKVNNGKTSPCTDSELRELISLADEYLDRFAHIGISQRFMIQNKRQPCEYNARIMGVRGYNLNLFPNPAPKFRLRTCEDIDFTMQLMAAGCPSAIITSFCQADGAYMAPGGCATWRTNEHILEDHRKLAAFWPNHVKLREGSDKPGGVLATIYMKKLARDSGLE